MKYIKTICAALLLSLFMAGCDSDDGDRINTANVSVGFGETVLSVKETVDFVTIPIVVGDDAERDGDIIVHATMKSSNAGFVTDKDIIITTETLRIPPGLGSINFEVALHVHTPGMDTGRNVEFEITQAMGASVGSNNTCRIDFVEQNFVEGRYNIKGVSMIYGSAATGRIDITTLDESLDHVRLDFGIGAKAVMEFREVVPELEYEVEIPPFQFIGIYNSRNVYLTWIKEKKEEDDPDTIELSKGVYYDRTRPIKGKFTRTVEDGKETSAEFSIEDGFGLLGIMEESYSWFDNFNPGATITKAQ